MVVEKHIDAVSSQYQDQDQETIYLFSLHISERNGFEAG